MSGEPIARPSIADIIAGARVDAELVESDDGWTLTVRRVLAHDRPAVWRMLTEPDQLARWSPIVPDRPLTSVGAVTSHESPGSEAVDVEVLHCDPPAELHHRWGAAILRWTLCEVPDGTRLTLAQSFPDRTHAPLYAAGWDICLAVLTVLDGGAETPRIVGPDAFDHGWHQLFEHYTTVFDRRTPGGTP